MNFLQATANKAAGILGRDSWVVRRLRPAYESLLERMSDGRGISWQINGVTYRIDPHYRHRMGHDYDAPVAEFLRSRVKPGVLCLDVGANVGVYVLQFDHWLRHTGRIIAFEPNPDARKILETHIRMNHLGDRVTVVPAAVGELSGPATLFAAGADGMSRLGAPNRLIADQTKPILVSVVTLDEYCEDHKIVPDWIFVDIEGFEIAALAGARKIITAGGDALGIVVEMHPNVWTSANTTRESAESLLADLQRRPVPLTGQRDPLGEHGLISLEPVV